MAALYKIQLSSLLSHPIEHNYAEVIYSNQGALGDDIFINVYENKGIDIFIFKILKKPQSFYESDLGEFGNIEEIYWKDDNCLVINSAEYKIE